MASGDFELTIVITAIDDASAVLQTVASEIEQFDASLSGLQQDTAETLQGLTQLSGALASAISLSAGAGADLSGADLGGDEDYSDQGSLGGLGLLTSDTNPLSDLAEFSNQAPDASGEAFGAAQGTPAALQVIQNNTFNGILDPSAIQDQVIPELERAVARGTTFLAAA